MACFASRVRRIGSLVAVGALASYSTPSGADEGGVRDCMIGLVQHLSGQAELLFGLLCITARSTL